MLFGKPVYYSRDYSFEFSHSIGKISYRFQIILLYWKIVLKKIFSFFSRIKFSYSLYHLLHGVPGYLPTDSESFFFSNHTYSQWLAPSSSKLAYQVYLPNHFTLLVSSSRKFSCLTSLCNPLKSNPSCYSETRPVPFELISHWVPHVIFYLLGLFCVTVSYHICSHLRNSHVLPQFSKITHFLDAM